MSNVFRRFCDLIVSEQLAPCAYIPAGSADPPLNERSKCGRA